MSGSQKFIARNRAPRVQIEYDVELYGAEKKVQLPFVMGVLSDLAGKSEQPPVADRKFLEIDVDNFDERMRSMAPRAAFTVPNTLTGEGSLAVELTFEKMEDFSPQAIAAKVDSLAPLLEARRKLGDLMAYMDGKSGAETLIETLLNAPELLQALAGGSADSADMDAALETLKARMPEPEPEDDTTERTLADLAAQTPRESPSAPSVDDVLGTLEAPPDAQEEPGVDDILGGIEHRETAQHTDRTEDVLAAIERQQEADGTDDTADVLAGIERREVPEAADDAADILSRIERRELAGDEDGSDDVLAGIQRRDEAAEPDPTDDVLATLEQPEPSGEDAGRALDDVLAGLEPVDHAAPAETTSTDILDGLKQPHAPAEEEDGDLADDILAGLDTPEGPDTDGTVASDTADPERGAAAGQDDLDDLLAGLGNGDDDAHKEGGGDPDALDALLADLGADDDAGTIAARMSGVPPDGDGPADDLDDLLAELGATDEGSDAAEQASGPGEVEGAAVDDLDDLLADMGTSDLGAADDAEDLDALLGDLAGDGTGDGTDDDLDALLADMGTAELGDDPAPDVGAEGLTAEAPKGDVGLAVAAAAPAQTPHGTISAPEPERESMNRNRFRMAIFGDFTGRSSRGLMETGAALAARRPILLDVDTVEDVIAGFATTLNLPLGKDGAGIEVKLSELDDLHPDELFENVEIFEAIAGLRQQLGVGSMAGKVTERLKQWAEEFGTPVRLPKRSAGTSVPPDLKLSDFQALIGDTGGTLTRATPADDLIARIVGPHVVKGPDAGAAEMLETVDEALSAAMRLVLHHPDFQAVESQWRSLDLLARRIETDSHLEIVLYDVSAEEMAADLSAHEDLAQSGLYRLLTEVMDPEDGDGGFSALFGLYTFEETPPHAELLARVGLVAAHVDAPFFAAITPAYLETPMEDRHKLVAEAWDRLRALPQAAYLGLASPRFMLRQPYGAKSDPCYEFEFEEFTPKEGLRGLLWANPVVLVAILLAATYKKDGRAMELGSLMSLGDIPFTFVTDRYGDQVALPCTERNLTSDAAQATLLRGYMPVLSMKGRNEVRLGSFRSLAGSEIAGPWADAPPARPAPSQATLEMDIPDDAASGGGSGDDANAKRDDDPLAELDALLDTDTDTGTEGLDLLDSGDDEDGQSLDDLLASFADDGDDAADDDDDMDPELAALLEGL